MTCLIERSIVFLGALLCAAAFAARASADTIVVPIVAEMDDLEEFLDGAEVGMLDVGSSDLELGTEGPPEPRQAVGLRFLDIGILPGSTINSASVQFMVDEADDEITNLRIFGELTPNSSPFTDTPFNISSRTRTSSSVVWSNIPVWTTEGDTGPDQRTPDLSPILTEIIGQAGWMSGNALSLIILPEPFTDNTGERTAISFNKSMGTPNFQPPILTVDFVPIPEPSSLALALLATLGMLISIRCANQRRVRLRR
ncbi:MAG: hypothetical protein WD894_15555 [Pirellulales bacterium]